MPITIDENGNATADGHSWIAYDYEEKDGQLFQIAILHVIEGQKVLQRILGKKLVWED